mgnify:CR=1 FL=1
MQKVIWITGLSGSGKSTVASALKEIVPEAVVLRMDEMRKVVTPEPSYSDSERECVYRSLVYTANTLYKLGHTVIIDATGNRRSWRDLARTLVPDYIEVYLKCALDLCIQRESRRVETYGAPKEIYKKAEAGSPVPGIHVPYEKSERPDLIVDTEMESPEEAAERIYGLMLKI